MPHVAGGRGGGRNHSWALRIRLGKVEEPSALPFGLAPRPLPPGARNLRIQGHGLALQDPVPLAGSAWAEGQRAPLSPAQSASSLFPAPAGASPRGSFVGADGCWHPSAHTEGHRGGSLLGGWTEFNYVDWGVHVQGLSVCRMEPGWGEEGWGGCQLADRALPHQSPKEPAGLTGTWLPRSSCLSGKEDRA